MAVDISGLARSVTELARKIEAAIAPLLIVDPRSVGDDPWPVLKAAILTKNLRSLQSSVRAIDVGEDLPKVSWLRSCAEELIWGSYLATIEDTTRAKLLKSLAITEVWDQLDAIGAKFGPQGIVDAGLKDASLRFYAGLEKAREDVSACGIVLGWPPKSIKEHSRPSVWFIAKAAGRVDDYKYIYHATSRHVHFCPSELLRLSWANGKSEIEFGAPHFSHYWHAFVVSEGARMLLDAVVSFGGLDSAIEELVAAFEPVQSFGRVPLVTSEELSSSVRTARKTA